MTHDDVQRWLDRYVDAWKSYDPARIGDLFADSIKYRYAAWRDPVVGREAVVDSWLNPSGDASNRDAPGTFEARYQPYAAEGRRAVAVGTSTYWTAADRAEVAHVYHNVYLLEFDAEGRCASFTEYWMERPRANPPT